MSNGEINQVVDDKAVQSIINLYEELKILKVAMEDAIRTAAEFQSAMNAATTFGQFKKAAEDSNKAVENLNKANVDMLSIQRKIKEESNNVYSTLQKEVDLWKKVDEAVGKIQVDMNELTGRIVENNLKLKENQKAQKEASDAISKSQKDYKNGVITLKEYNDIYDKNFEKLQLALETQQELKAQLSEQHITLKNVTKEQASAAGSMDEMAQKLGGLRDAYRGLSEEERNNADIGGVMKEGINQLDEALKALDTSIGNNQRNVGNYQIASKSMVAELRNMKNELLETKININFFTDEISKQKGVLSDLAKSHGENSKEYKESEERLVALEKNQQNYIDTSKDLTAAIKELTKEQNLNNAEMKMQADPAIVYKALAEGVNLVVQSYAAYKGVLALVGSENKELEKTMKKLMGLMQVANAVQRVTNSLIAQNGIITKTKVIWEKVSIAYNKELAIVQAKAAAATEAQGTAAAASTTANVGLAAAIKLVGKAIKSIPVIGWILAGISALITLGIVLNKILGQEKELNSEQKLRLKNTEDIATAQQEANKKIIEQKNYLEANMRIIEKTKAYSAEWSIALENIKNIIGDISAENEKDTEFIRQKIEAYNELYSKYLVSAKMIESANQSEIDYANAQVDINQKLNESKYHKVELTKEELKELKKTLLLTDDEADTLKESFIVLGNSIQKYGDLEEKKKSGLKLTYAEKEAYILQKKQKEKILELTTKNGEEIAKNAEKTRDANQANIDAEELLKKQLEGKKDIDKKVSESDAKTKDRINKNNQESLKLQKAQREKYYNEMLKLYENDAKTFAKYEKLKANELADIDAQIFDDRKAQTDKWKNEIDDRAKYFKDLNKKMADLEAKTDEQVLQNKIANLREQEQEDLKRFKLDGDITKLKGKHLQERLDIEKRFQLEIDKLNEDFAKKQLERLQQVTNETLQLTNKLNEERIRNSNISNEEMTASLVDAVKKRHEDEFKQIEIAKNKELEIYGNFTELEKQILELQKKEEEGIITDAEKTQLSNLELAQSTYLATVEKWDAKIAEQTQKNADEIVKIKKEGFNKTLADLNQQMQDEENLAIIKKGGALSDTELLDKKLTNIDKEIKLYEDKKKALIEAGMSEEAYLNKMNELGAKRVLTVEEQAKREMQMRIDVATATTDAFFSISNAMADTLEDEKERVVVQQGLAMAQVLLNQGMAIAKATNASSGIPFPGNLIAIATSIGVIATQFISSFAAIRKAQSAYEFGTDYHRGGSALVGEGRNAEWVQTPSGKTYLADKPTFFEKLPVGSSVTPLPDFSMKDYFMPKHRLPEFTSTDTIGNWNNAEIVQKLDRNNALMEQLLNKPTVNVDVSDKITSYIQSKLGKSKILNSKFGF